MNVKAMIKKASDVVYKNSPYILTALGAVGVVSTAIFTGKASIKAKEVIEDIEAGVYDDQRPVGKATPKEIVEHCWKLYLPAVINGGLAIACIIFANNTNMKRQAAIATLYSISETNFKEYKDKVIETIGTTKEEKIHDEIVQDRLLKDPVDKKHILITGHGETLCYDMHSGRYFYSDIETIRRIINDLNHDLMGEMWIDLNSLYYALGIGGIKLGDYLGWTTDELIEPIFTTKLTNEGRPCLVLDYNLDTRGLK